MKKKTLIIDLDGTIYHQYIVQLIMGCWLILYYFVHLCRLKELLIIMYFRKIRRQNIENIVDKQYLIVAKKYGVSEKKVEKLVEYWLLKKPLKILKVFKNKSIERIIYEFKEASGKIIFYSDYPTEDKLKAMNILYDKAYDSTHSKIRVLKPNQKGLQYIIKSNNLNKDTILLIGDSDKKDGECARRCGVDYVIISKNIFNKNYSLIKQKLE